MEGETLRARLAHARPPLAEAMAIGIAIAEGLGAAHAVGIVHRDIKPENVMIGAGGIVKVLDFGLAKLVASSPSDVAASTLTMVHTDPGTVLGTVAYMSPEQVRGREVDQRTDILVARRDALRDGRGAMPLRWREPQRRHRGHPRPGARTNNAI